MSDASNGSACAVSRRQRSSIVVAEAQTQTATSSPFHGLYVFESGSIKGLDPKLFNFTREELKEVDFVEHRPI